ncbi:uncharacterized protein LOC104000095 [Musa acuminata AAA Group]|uniref:uncharacterized protein LOC104000095 n=1 Tax=Musa acuminata AAA Group TaxID=214697 RepID=UPI0031E1A154
MEGEENRREQTPGSASHGGGKVCHRCGWVYPNPHPSKKHRTAHRKHCSAAAPGLSDGAADVAAAVEVKKAPPEQLSDEDPRNVSGEEVVEEEPKPEGEKGRGMDQSGVDVEEPCKGAILEAGAADYSPESDASCHGNKVPSSDVESTASQLDDTMHLDNDSVTCRGDKVCTMEGTDSSSESPLTKGFCLDALKEEMDNAAVQNMVDSATVEDNIIIGNYVEDKLDMQIPGPQILPHGSCANSSLTDSEFQRIDKSMEFSIIVDQANAITTLISGLPDEVSANTMEFESVICTSPDEKTDVAGQISQVQPFCNDGPSMGFSMIVDQANSITTLISGLPDEVSANTMEFESVICTSPDEKTDVAGQISQVQPFCNDGPSMGFSMIVDQANSITTLISGLPDEVSANTMEFESVICTSPDEKTDVAGQISQVQPFCNDGPSMGFSMIVDQANAITTLISGLPDEVSANTMEFESVICISPDEKTDVAGQISQVQPFCNDGPSMGFSMIVDQANAITTLISGLPDEVSANTMEFESVICTSPDEKTDVAGQISQVQPFCNDGPSMGFSMIVDQANAITTLISGLPDEVLANTMEFESVICISPDEKTDVAGQISQVQPFCNDGPSMGFSMIVDQANAITTLISGLPDEVSANTMEFESVICTSPDEKTDVAGQISQVQPFCNDPSMGFSMIVDQANAITTLISGLPDEVSENTMEFESVICTSPDEKTDVAGQISQVQPFCNDGPSMGFSMIVDQANPITTLISGLPDEVLANTMEFESVICTSPDEKTDVAGQISQVQLFCNDGPSMGFSMIVDQANAITTLISGLPDEVSANTMEFESVICTSPDEKTDVAGQISQVQPFCNDGPSMGFSMIVDQANAITTLISGLPDEVSANTMEFESVICTSPDDKTDVAGQISQVQPFCNDGPCNLEITDGELFETPTHLSACGYQIALPANSPVNGNDPEYPHSLPISSNMLLVESTKVKIESLEDSGLVEPDLTICANAEAGSNIGRHVIDELSVVESDKNAKSISSTLQVNVNEMERDESKDERNCQDMNSDRSQVVNEFEFEVGASANKFEGPKGESDWLKTPEQVPSVNKAMDLDDRVPNSCETCNLYKGKGTNLSHEGISADNLRVADSAVSLSGMSQFSATSEISNNSQIVRQGTTEINIDALVEDKNLEMFKENNMDLKTNSQPEGHTTELEPPTRDDIGRTELQNNEDVIVADSVLSLTQEDFSFRCLRSVLNNYLDQQDVQETPVERFKQNADLDETIDQSQRQAETFFKEEISENGLPSEHYDILYPNKDETNKMETTCGYQLELQNVFVVGSINHVSSDKNNSYNPFVTEMDHVPTAEKEYSLLTILEDEPNTNEHSKAGLCHDDEEILKTEECSESKIDVRSFIGKPGNDYDSKTSDRSGVAPSIFYQSSKEEDVHDKSMQQNEFYIEMVDYSINSNSQTGNIDAVSESVPDGAIPSLSSAMEEGSNFDAEVSPPTDSLVTRDLHTSDPTTEGATHKSNLDHNDTLEEPSDPAADSLATKDLHTSDPATERTIHNLDHNDTLEEPSLIPLVEPEQKSDSIENKSVHDSKDEPEGRNIKDENTAGKVPDSNAGKPHVMLKNLLAEAELESKQEATGSQGYNASPSSKRSCGGSQDDGQSLRTAISDGPLDTQADHREWNSPARLPVTKHEKKKAKGRQSWVPFICCPSVN